MLAEQYGTEVLPEFISSVTDAVMPEVTAWQSRPLEVLYPVVFFDALRVKICQDAEVRNKAISLALGVRPDGTRYVLGLWIDNTEGAKFWMKVFNDLKARSVADILIAVIDGLKGIGEALDTVFPATTLQKCVVHTIRTPLRASAGRTTATGRSGPQWNDMANLQGAVADDDALDDKLQECLLLRKGRLFQARTDAGASAIFVYEKRPVKHSHPSWHPSIPER